MHPRTNWAKSLNYYHIHVCALCSELCCKTGSGSYNKSLAPATIWPSLKSLNFLKSQIFAYITFLTKYGPPRLFEIIKIKDICA